MKQSQFYYLLRRGLFSAGSAIIKNGLVMFNKFTTAGISHPAQGSAEFNGTSDFIDTGINIDTTQSMTFSAWVYLSNISTARAIVGDGYPSGGEAGFAIIATTNANDVIVAYGSTTKTLGVLPGLNKWYYITTSFDSNAMKVYIDGSLLHSSVYANANPQHDRSIFVGCRRGQGSPYGAIQFWDGNLANVAIWNRALSSDEINSVMWKSYEALSGAESNGLQAWYSLDDITSPAASLANMEQLATDKDATIENKAAITAAINALS